jgi:hypothetical protein
LEDLFVAPGGQKSSGPPSVGPAALAAILSGKFCQTFFMQYWWAIFMVPIPFWALLACKLASNGEKE